MDNINSRTNDKSMGFIFGGDGFVFINNIYEQLSKLKSNIEILVDIACGYNEMEEARKECISLLEQIIESKKAIDADYSGD